MKTKTALQLAAENAELEKEIKRLEGKVRFLETWLRCEQKASDRLLGTALNALER